MGESLCRRVSTRTVRGRAERAGERAKSVNEELQIFSESPPVIGWTNTRRLAGQQQVRQMEVVQPQHAVSSDEEKQQTDQQEAQVEEDLEGLCLLFVLRSTLDFCLLKPWRRLRLRAPLLPPFCPSFNSPRPIPSYVVDDTPTCDARDPPVRRPHVHS